jgi:hypothetical protein
MPLTDDQRAMLQLLLQQGQSYEDIASLLGLEVEQVRSRAREALTEIGGEDPDRDVGLTDYLLGQADPIGRADAARQLGSDPKTRELADRLTTQLRLLAPGAELPDIAGDDSGTSKPKERKAPAPTPAAAPAPKAKPEPSGETDGGGLAATLSRHQRQAIAGLLGVGILVAVVVLAIAGVFGGGDDDSSAASSDGTTTQQTSGASNLTRAVLTPQGGSEAEGVAVFARIRNQAVLQINVTNLQPTGSGEGYVIWLFGGESQAFPLVRQEVGENGQMRGAAPIPNQLLQALQQGLFDSIDISLATNSQITDALRQARQSQQLPRYAGTSVARGPITGPGFTGEGSAQSGSSG